MTENFYRSIIENIPVGYGHYKIIYDKDDLVEDFEIIDANKILEEIIEMKRESLIGRRVKSVFKGRCNWLDFFQSIENNHEDTEIEYHFEIIDKYYRLNIHYPDQNHMVIFSRDITRERKQTENYELFAENTETQIWYLQDPYTYGTTNKAHADFLGKNKKDIEFKKLTSFLPPEEAAVCIEVNKKAFKEKKKTLTQEWLGDSHGERRLLKVLKNPKFNPQGEVEFISCSAEDITELRMSEEKFSKAFNLSGTSMIISTIDDGEFVEVNDAFLDIVGYEREEIIGKKIDNQNIFRSLSRDENTREKITKEIEKNQRLYNYEVEMISKDKVG